MLYLATIGSVVAFSAYMYLVATVRPSLAMSYAYVNPAIAVLLGALIADEVVTRNLMIALPIIIGGVAIVTRSQSGSSTQTDRAKNERTRHTLQDVASPNRNGD